MITLGFRSYYVALSLLQEKNVFCSFLYTFYESQHMPKSIEDQLTEVLQQLVPDVAKDPINNQWLLIKNDLVKSGNRPSLNS